MSDKIIVLGVGVEHNIHLNSDEHNVIFPDIKTHRVIKIRQEHNASLITRLNVSAKLDGFGILSPYVNISGKIVVVCNNNVNGAVIHRKVSGNIGTNNSVYSSGKISKRTSGSIEVANNVTVATIANILRKLSEFDDMNLSQLDNLTLENMDYLVAHRR